MTPEQQVFHNTSRSFSLLFSLADDCLFCSEQIRILLPRRSGTFIYFRDCRNQPILMTSNFLRQALPLRQKTFSMKNGQELSSLECVGAETKPRNLHRLKNSRIPLNYPRTSLSTLAHSAKLVILQIDTDNGKVTNTVTLPERNDIFHYHVPSFARRSEGREVKQMAWNAKLPGELIINNELGI